MLKVISFKICPFVQRVTALLEAKKIAYEVVFIDLNNKPEWFLQISPTGQVPILVTEDDVALFESEAIIEYLEDVYPPLEPNQTPATKAASRAWSYLASKNYLVQCSAQRSADKETLQARTNKLALAFDKIERQLSGTPFFSGSTMGLVDIAWLPLLHRAYIIKSRTGFDFLGDRPKLKAWQEQLLATAIPAASVAEDFEDSFTEFYLSDKTFLGRGCNVSSGAIDQACETDACC